MSSKNSERIEKLMDQLVDADEAEAARIRARIRELKDLERELNDI